MTPAVRRAIARMIARRDKALTVFLETGDTQPAVDYMRAYGCPLPDDPAVMRLMLYRCIMDIPAFTIEQRERAKAGARKILDDIERES